MTTTQEKFGRKNTTTTCTVSAGGQVSTAVNAGGMSLIGIVTPAIMISTAITIQASIDNSTFVDVYNSAGTQISVTTSTSASRYIAFTPSDFVAFQYFKLKCGSVETGGITLTCVLRAI